MVVLLGQILRKDSRFRIHDVFGPLGLSVTKGPRSDQSGSLLRRESGQGEGHKGHRQLPGRQRKVRVSESRRVGTNMEVRRGQEDRR